MLAGAAVETLIEERAFASGPPADSALVPTNASAIDRLTSEQVETMTRKPYPKTQVPRVLDVLRAARSYRSGERAIRLVIQVADGLALSDVEVVADEFVKNDQIHHAGDVP